MLASIFEENLNECLRSHNSSLPKSLSIFYVYEKFLEFQCALYCNCCSELSRDEMKYKFYKELTYVSMLSAFYENQNTQIMINFLKTFTDEFSDFTCDINKFSFLHQELQHYVIAKWFTENYQNHTQMIRETYFEVDFQLIWGIFDQLLAKGNDLHNAVLNKDIDKLRNVILNRSELNSLDMGGRSALHLTAIQGKYHNENNFDGITTCNEIISILINNGIDVSIRDSVLNWTALSYADKIGYWATIEELLKVDSDVTDLTITNDKLCTHTSTQEILCEAALNEYVHIIAFILDTKKHDIDDPLECNRYSHQKYGLLHIAAENCLLILLEFLLNNGAFIDKTNWDKNTSLHLACRNGKTESVKMLLEKGANTYLTNKNDDTCLHEAVRGGHAGIVGILLMNNVDVNAYNIYGDTAFHIACRVNNLTTVSYLLDQNIEKSVRNKNGDSPLECAIWEGHTALVKYVLGKCKQCLKIRSKDHRHPLHVAAMKGDVLTLDYVLQVSSQVDVTTLGEDTPLHLASLHSKADAAVFLLKNGADVNKSNKFGNTALHLSSLQGNVNTMKVLLEYQADINANNIEGNTPLHLASLQGKASAVHYLISCESDVNIKNRERNSPLQLAVQRGSLEVIRLLSEAGADVNAVDRYDNAILHCAVNKRREDVVRVITSTCECNINVRDHNGDTPLHIAIKSGLTNIVQTLVQAGADINLVDDKGYPPLHIAAADGNMELVSLLIESGVNVDFKDDHGNTPLHRAALYENYTIMKFLVNKGADKSIQNCLGKTAYDICVQVKSPADILKML